MATALCIRGGQVFYGDPVRRLQGDLWVSGGVVRDPAAITSSGDVEVFDASGCIVLPGLVVAHHHLYSTLARGMPGPAVRPESFVEVLERIWWRLDRALDLDLVEISARAGSLEALRTGATAIIDHHASPNAIDGSLNRVAQGMNAAGVRGVVCYETTDRHGDDGFAAGLAENDRFARGVGKSPVGAMVGAHASFTLSDAHLRAVADLARKHDVHVHLHVSEDAADEADARRRGATDVIARLEQAGVLAGKAVLAHGVHLDASERARVQGAWLTHQPRSNMNNHVGYLGAAREWGDRVALGTDGINGDLFDEAHAAFFRMREHDRRGTAETVWSWLAGGWRLLSECNGLAADRGFGWFVPGAPGDVIVLDYDAPTPVTADNLPWHLAFGMSSRHVRDVIVAGEVVIRNRRSTRLNDASERALAREAAERLWEATGDDLRN